MRRAVLFNIRALRDVVEAREWYDRQLAGLGSDFSAAVKQAVASLEVSAEQYPFYYRDARRILLDRFPYKLFFRISGSSVRILRILHSARDHTREIR